MRPSSRHPLGVTILCASFVGCSAITSFDGFVPDGVTASGSSDNPDGASSTSGSVSRDSAGTSSGAEPCTALQSTGRKNGSSATTGPRREGGLGRAWADTSYALLADGEPTVAQLSADSNHSGSLRVSGFGFGVPEGARIRGVSVHVRVQQTNTADIVDEAVSLVVGSQRSDAEDNDEALPPTYATVTYGGDDQTWGLDESTLTPAAVNSLAFGVDYEVKYEAANGDGFAHVDEITVEVHYCE